MPAALLRPAPHRGYDLIVRRLAWLLVCASCGGDGESNAPPIAVIDVQPLAQAGEAVVLDASASGDTDGYIVLYRFVFADGTPELLTSSSVLEHAFPRAGRYDVGVVAVDDDGAETLASASITITDEPVTQCDPGETACAGVCVDTDTDPANCGGCGVPCDGDCVNGECFGMPPDCSPGQELCDGACVNTLVDASHCGFCGNRCDPFGCAGGMCQMLGRGEVIIFEPGPLELITGLSQDAGAWWFLIANQIVATDGMGNVVAQFFPVTSNLAFGLAAREDLVWHAARDPMDGMADMFTFDTSGVLLEETANVGGGITVAGNGDRWVYLNFGQSLVRIPASGEPVEMFPVEAPPGFALTDIAWDHQGGVWGVRPLLPGPGGGAPLLVNIDIASGAVTQFEVTVPQGWGGVTVADEGYLVVAGQDGTAALVP